MILDEFVAEYLKIKGVSSFLEAPHYDIVSSETMPVMSALEWLHKDGAGVNMKLQNDVVVAASGANYEADHVVCEDLDDGMYLDE